MIVVLAIIVAFILLVYRNFIQKIIWEKNLQHEQEIQHQKAIALQSIKAQEEERKRIALLVHDDIGNKLNILAIWLSNPHAWNSERAMEIVNGQLPQLVEAARNISHALFPVNIERFGLALALEELIAQIETSLHAQLIVRHPYMQKDIAFEVQLYRIIQEFLSNVLKHAKASHLFIHLRDTSNCCAILLADNGIGFEPNARNRGMGLGNIRSRIMAMNASYKWKSSSNKGCQLIIVIPKT